MSRPWSDEEIKYLAQLETRKIPIYLVYCELRRAGFNRSYKAVQDKVYDMTRNGELAPKIHRTQKIGYLDIETTNLNADFGFILTWAIKERDSERIFHDSIKQEDILAFRFDKKVLKSLIETLKKFDTVVTYYGSRFDVPFIRTRALYHNLKFPAYDQLHSIDLYDLIRGKMSLRSNRLSVVTQFLGMRGKTPLDPNIWIKAQFGHKESLKYVLNHNLMDVKLTERLHKATEKFAKGVIRSV